jgi:membrane fusion protein (multidrug efflux system)
VLNHRIAQLEVAQAEALLRQRALVSPVDGVVMERLLRPGEFRHDQSPVFTLAQLDPLRVEVFVPAAYHGQVRAGMAGQVVADLPGARAGIAAEREIEVLKVWKVRAKG